MSSIYDNQRVWKFTFIAVATAVAVCFLYISNTLVGNLARQEHKRMQIWADATKQIATSAFDDDGSHLDFLFSIIQENDNIPVMIVDNEGNILQHRNFRLPDKNDDFSEQNMNFLRDKLEDIRDTDHHIEIIIDDAEVQHLYYEDSNILRQIQYYPYVQVIVMLVFILVVYFAVMSIKKAEQNRVWVGLSKETAHQLGTPISSLMAWAEILESFGVDKEVVTEMNKDVKRLSMIADRFSKIGSIPELELAYINETVSNSLSYMSSRISKRVTLSINSPEHETPVMLCQSLFAWVMENLTKNAVDAMQGVGSITVNITSSGDHVNIDVTDTGKGIPRKNFDTVFKPGFSTKKRGWGLGLTLVKRIIEEYHKGKIYVKESEIDRGTTFRIELPIASNNNNK